MITCIVLQLTRFFMTVIKYITLLLRFDFAVKFALRTEQSFNCATRGNLVVTAARETHKQTAHRTQTCTFLLHIYIKDSSYQSTALLLH